MPLFSPAFTSSRNTVSYSSLIANPRGIEIRRVWVVNDQNARTALTHLQVAQLGLAAEAVPNQQGRVECDACACIHASWQRELGQHSRARRRSVGTERYGARGGEVECGRDRAQRRLRCDALLDDPCADVSAHSGCVDPVMSVSLVEHCGSSPRTARSFTIRSPHRVARRAVSAI
jgi:hypothetical protein